MTRSLFPLAAVAALAACDRAPEPRKETTAATPVATPSPSPPAAPAALAKYIGRYPLDEVSGGAFLNDPAVRATVAGVVPDADVRARVLDRDVTATPIVLDGDRLLSFGCEPHNCGPHNWAIAIRRDGSGGAVCYYDQDRNVARWYPAGAGETPASGCPSGDN
ncbi:hypothetical protein [Sphingomonas corticis]|uniref:Lipoprotein n=1 Tax=Sphingomonas corticis TaxID=2722791 RepID=A0ABX1CME9_9SPHN|nr:hypothetical protein [Sphingomonas corticis]NJR79114.1 hypothetical protein [Sphingomonas corticis]